MRLLYKRWVLKSGLHQEVFWAIGYTMSERRCEQKFSHIMRRRHDCDRMVVGFTTTCAISAYHH